MAELQRAEVRQMMADVLAKQGKELPEGDDATLESIGFRSLDFSELALRVEDEVGDVLDFIGQLTAEA